MCSQACTNFFCQLTLTKYFTRVYWHFVITWIFQLPVLNYKCDRKVWLMLLCSVLSQCTGQCKEVWGGANKPQLLKPLVTSNMPSDNFFTNLKWNSCYVITKILNLAPIQCYKTVYLFLNSQQSSVSSFKVTPSLRIFTTNQNIIFTTKYNIKGFQH